jgi:hypothetical protein
LVMGKFLFHRSNKRSELEQAKKMMKLFSLF